jgi:hypothetical protein
MKIATVVAMFYLPANLVMVRYEVHYTRDDEQTSERSS